MEIKIDPSVSHIIEGTKNRIYARIQIKVEEEKQQKESERKPLSLCLVLDRSGSMSGDRIRYVKIAAKMVAQNLTSKDLVSLVAYDDVIEVPFQGADPAKFDILSRHIDALTARNMTALSAGVISGQDILEKYKSDDRLNRMFLLTDGLANVGITATPELAQLAGQIREKGSVMSTFGVGDDFNEDLLVAMADKAGGEFYFIDQPDKIPEIISEELQGLLAVVGQNAKIIVTSSDSASSVNIMGNEEDTIDLGDLRSGETRMFVVELNVDPDKLEAFPELLAITLEYKDVHSLDTKRQEMVFTAPPITSDASKVEENSEILAYVGVLQAADMEVIAMEQMRSHDYVAASASLGVALSNLEELDSTEEVEEKRARLRSQQRSLEQADYKTARKSSMQSWYGSKKSRRKK